MQLQIALELQLIWLTQFFAFLAEKAAFWSVERRTTITSVEPNWTLNFKFIHFADKNARALEMTIVEAQKLEVDVAISILLLTQNVFFFTILREIFNKKWNFGFMKNRTFKIDA